MELINQDSNLAAITIKDGYDSTWIDQIMTIHNKTDMGRAQEFKKMVNDAFASSFAVATAWKGNRLIACGRAISDGQMYSGIFDVVVDPEFQKRGVGRAIVTRLTSKVPQTCIHLTSTFGNEEFYHRVGFKKHKTAMALYPERMAASPYLDQEWAPAAKAKHIDQPRLETARLFLEPYQDKDLEDIYAYASNPDVTKFLTWPTHTSLDDSKNFLKWVRATTSHKAGSLFFVFAIRSKESGKVIGSIDFKNPQPWTGQTDYVLGIDHWGKGLMTEAVTSIRDWSFQSFPDLMRFQAFCQPENQRSARVMQKVGMKFEGIRQKSFKVQGKIVDTSYYALIRANS